MNIPVLPESSPFTAEQRHWLNGFLAGISNTILSGAGSISGALTNNPGNQTPSSPPISIPVQILFGTQSGTAEGLAHTLADKLKTFSQSLATKIMGTSVNILPSVQGMDQFKEVSWSDSKYFLLISSTWGEGDMPDNAIAFWEWLKSTDAPSLAHVSYSVLGLGDRNYARFCQAGKNLDSHFEALGATRLSPLVECDTDYESSAQKWMDDSISALELIVTSELPTNLEPSQKIQKLNAPAPKTELSSSTVLSKTPSSEKTNPVSSGTVTFSRKNPFLAPLLQNKPLNGIGSAKDTRHLAFSLLGSGLNYKVGDALGVYPRNCHDLVEQILLALNCNGNEKVSLSDSETFTLRAGLVARFDLRKGTEKLIHLLNDTCTDSEEQKRLSDLLIENGAKLQTYLSDKDLLDVLHDFSKTSLEPQKLIETLNKLAHRLYSISSSPNENPGEVHLTVGIVRYNSSGRNKKGVASTFMAERVPLGEPIPVFIQPTAHFSLPSESTRPIIMVGPGTGIAPFRAFLQERRFQGHTGKNWLIFGDQKQAVDFLYQDELAEMRNSGILTDLDLAFSRDQSQKIYVQTRLLEKSKQLFDWLESDAHFYVCGDAKHMAKDVEEALLQVITKESGHDFIYAKSYLDSMKEQKRYQRDVY